MAGYQGLRYRTINDASPQGKPRVYLCSHQDDLPSFLEPVATEVLTAQATAAVWYRDPADGEPDEQALLDDLSQMQLFVVPVTSQFLAEDCPARTVELAFALAHHIPVLPIIEEPGLAEAFNRICGEIQCLDRCASETDPTALPFEQRLGEYVNQVLVGDELSARIRAAFDASAFLSYRKKDRAHAQRVMALIHEVPSLRDVAIWYDEFLVPGEGFNEAILDALDASSFVALVVTPNLLEDSNYVMTIEYPQAREHGKPVLPIEAVNTDASLLSRDYPGIGEVVSAGSDAALAAGLTRVLAGTALGQGAGDPEHDYLIGLAYLMGVDVEVNRARALQLIRGAAEAGNIEALERMVSMYAMGEGVAHDHREAIAWQERLVEELGKRAEADPTVANLQALCHACSKLGDHKRDMRDFAGARAAYDSLSSYADALGEAGDPEARHWKLTAYARLGIVEGFGGNLLRARFWHMEAIKGLEELASDNADIDVRRNLASEYGNLGIILGREGKQVAARECAERAARYAKELAEETGGVEDRRIYAQSCLTLANRYYDDEDLANARTWYELSCDVWKAIVGDTAQQQDWASWASALEKLGDLHFEEGQLAEARACHELSYRVRLTLAERTDSVPSRRDLALSCWSLGEICEEEGDLSGALEKYQNAVGLLASVVNETHSEVETHEYGTVCSCAGDVAMKQGDFPAAELWFRRSADAFKALAGRSGELSERRLLAAAYSKRGDTHFCRHDCASARPWYLQAYQLRRQMADEEGGEDQLRDLAFSTVRLAKTCQNEGDGAGARFWYEQTLDTKRSIARMTGALDDWETLMLAYDDLARLQGIPTDDRRRYLEGVATLAFQLYQASGSDQHGAYLIYAQEQLAELS